jgi:hypothetical protein
MPTSSYRTPHLDIIGEKAARFLAADLPAYRHVQSVTLLSASSLRMRMTVDLDLPHDPDSGFGETAHGYHFILPVAFLDKTPPVNRLDFSEESGHTLPLRTKEENARINLRAVNWLIADLPDPPKELLSLAEGMVKEDPSDALPYKIWMDEVLLTEQAGSWSESRLWSKLHPLLSDLVDNSLIWVDLYGHLGQRRSVQYCYDRQLDRAPLIPRRGRVSRYRLRLEPHPDASPVERTFELELPGDDDERGFIARGISRGANALGLAPIDYWIDAPLARGCRSYHFQVSAPGGLDVADVQLRGRELAVNPDLTLDSLGAHLYAPRCDAKDDYAEPEVVVALRVARQGFLSWAAAIGVIVSALLWAFVISHSHLKLGGQTQRPSARISGDPSLAAAIMLLTPAVLLAFAVRTEEHALATRMLTGIRVLLLTIGLCAVLSAGALAGLLPNRGDLGEFWKIYATVATAGSLVLSLAWFLAHDVTDRRRPEHRRRSRSAVVWRILLGLLLATFLVGYGGLYPKRYPGEEGHQFIGLLMAGTGFWLAYTADSSRSLARRGRLEVFPTAAFLGALLSLAAGVAAFGATPWSSSPAQSWRTYASALFVLVLVTALWEAVLARREDA